jgi:hypothetical protein
MNPGLTVEVDKDIESRIVAMLSHLEEQIQDGFLDSHRQIDSTQRSIAYLHRKNTRLQTEMSSIIKKIENWRRREIQ